MVSYPRYTITLKDYQLKWLKDNCICVSKFFQKSVDEAMQKRGNDINEERTNRTLLGQES